MGTLGSRFSIVPQYKGQLPQTLKPREPFLLRIDDCDEGWFTNMTKDLALRVVHMCLIS